MFGKRRASCSRRSFFSFIYSFLIYCVNEWYEFGFGVIYELNECEGGLCSAQASEGARSAMQWYRKRNKKQSGVRSRRAYPRAPLRRVKISCLAGNEQAFHICIVRTLGGHMAPQGKDLQEYAGSVLSEDIIMRYIDALRKKQV